MIPDAEIISLLGTILTKLEVGDFTIKVSAPGPKEWRTLTRVLLSAE